MCSEGEGVGVGVGTIGGFGPYMFAYPTPSSLVLLYCFFTCMHQHYVLLTAPCIILDLN